MLGPRPRARRGRGRLPRRLAAVASSEGPISECATITGLLAR